MIIKTKFEIGEKVVLIDNNIIITLPVKEIEYVQRKIFYLFCKSKAVTTLDNDIIIQRCESECFKSAFELAEYYERNITE